MTATFQRRRAWHAPPSTGIIKALPSPPGEDLCVARIDWTREELILALDVYFRSPAAKGTSSHPAIIEMSKILNELPIHGRENRNVEFRNTNGVSMKLSNFLRFDPSYKGKGLQ